MITVTATAAQTVAMPASSGIAAGPVAVHRQPAVPLSLAADPAPVPVTA